jgi:AraC family transcriptional regulator
MKSNTRQTYQERILNVLVHIQNHLDETLALEDLARVAHFSPYHFHRMFRGMVGESVKEHVRRLRLERAAHRLKFTDLPVTRIAFEAGYETHEAFTRAFRALFEESPSGFRETHQPIPYPKAPADVHYDPSGKLAGCRLALPQQPPLAVRLEDVAPLRLAFMRHVGPYADVGRTWMRFMMWAGMRGLLKTGWTMIGIVHDDPEVTPADKVRYDACLTVDDRFQPEGDVGVQGLDGGAYAVATHLGPYQDLSDTYARLCGDWLLTSGCELRSTPCFEIYRNSPQDTPPHELRTDIHVPLEA